MEEDRRVWMRNQRQVIREYVGYQNINSIIFRANWNEFRIIEEVDVMYNGGIGQYLNHLQELGVHVLRVWVNEGDGQTNVEMYKHLLLYGALLFTAEAHLIEDGDNTVGKIFFRCRPRYHNKLVDYLQRIGLRE